VLRNDALAALAVAVAGGGSFLRVNVLSGAAVTDQGLVQGQAAELLRRRAALRRDIAILADVDVKHATALDTRPLGLRARDLVHRARADAVLVTGPATGQPVDVNELSEVAEAVAPVPVLAASGTTPANVAAALRHASGVIVGSALKHSATGRVDRTRAAAFVEAARA
jgi:membrane complex biogenesis BtpA family protein